MSRLKLNLMTVARFKYLDLGSIIVGAAVSIAFKIEE